MYVAVSAVDHPDLDAWVLEQAEDEAARGGLRLGDYLGREDVLGDNRAPDLCCHIFAAAKAD